jgi:hypothetical protein
MRRRLFVFFLFSVFLISSMPASASPLYLTLSGKVSGIRDGGWLAHKSDIHWGDTLNYIVSVDTDQMGSTTSHNGRTYDLGGTFFTTLESGNLMGQNQNAHSDQLNWGADYGYASVLRSGNENSNLYLTKWGFDPTDFKVGDIFTDTYEIAYSHGNHFSRIDLGNLVITGISTSAATPTPVPGAFLLMGSGLFAVGYLRRKLA